MTPERVGIRLGLLIATLGMLAACGGGAPVQDSPPASVLACPEPSPAAGEWKRTASVPPLSLMRDPVFPDIVYGFTWEGILRSSDDLRSFCPVYRWQDQADAGGFAHTILAGSVRRDLRIVRGTYWGPFIVSMNYGSSWSRMDVRVAANDAVKIRDATIDPTTDTLYAIAEDLGLIASSDHGQSWRLLQPNPEGTSFTGLVAGPKGAGLYVTAGRPNQTSEIWSSRDGGGTWERTATPVVTNWDGFQVAFTEPVTLYTFRAEAPRVPLRSRDGGKTFETLARQGDVRLHPTHPQAIYLVTASDDPSLDGPLALSLDGGDSFTEFPSWDDSRRTLDGDPPYWPVKTNAPSLFDARDPARIIVRTDLGFFEAEVDGTVRALGSGIVPAFGPLALPVNTSPPPYHFWVDPRSAVHLLAAANGALMESRDGGETFSLHEGTKRFEVSLGAEQFPSDESPAVFAVDAGNPDAYYLWGRTTLWVSDHAGRDWTPQALGDKVVLSVDPVSPSTLYARPSSDDPPPPVDCARWRSRDRGQTWQCLAAVDPAVVAARMLPDIATLVPTATPLRDFVTHPADARVIYGFDGGIGFYRSSDGGASWSTGQGLPLFPPFQPTNIRMLVAPSDPDRLFVIAQDYQETFREGLFASADRGSTWRLMSSGQAFRAALVDPQSSDVLYGEEGENIPVSTDGGLTWMLGGPAPVGETSLSVLAVARSTPSVVYARGEQGIYRR